MAELFTRQPLYKCMVFFSRGIILEFMFRNVCTWEVGPRWQHRKTPNSPPTDTLSIRLLVEPLLLKN